MFTVGFFFTPSGKVVGGGDDIQEGPVPTIWTPESGQGGQLGVFTIKISPQSGNTNS